jgi:hypothetical protein
VTSWIVVREARATVLLGTALVGLAAFVAGWHLLRTTSSTSVPSQSAVYRLSTRSSGIGRASGARHRSGASGTASGAREPDSHQRRGGLHLSSGDAGTAATEASRPARSQPVPVDQCNSSSAFSADSPSPCSPPPVPSQQGMSTY